MLVAAARTGLARPSLFSKLARLYTAGSPRPTDLLNDLDAPPTAGPEGYTPPHPTTPNPVSERRAAQGLRSVADRPAYKLHCHSSRNNTIVTLANQAGNPQAWFSGGSCGFKKANRATYEAGYQCAVRAFRRIEEIHHHHPLQLELYFKGFGQGRDALRTALLAAEGEKIRPLVISITDRTALKIGGTRAKKTRRL